MSPAANDSTAQAVALARVEEQLVALRDVVTDLRGDIREQHDATAGRVEELRGELTAVKAEVADLQKWRWKLVGIATGLSTLGASGAVALVKALGH